MFRRLIVLSTISALLSGCGGSDSDEASVSVSTDTPEAVTESIYKYLDRNAVDFRATDYDGQPRPLRNDLSGGTLAGEVMFAQSHTVQPNNNFVQDAGDETRSVYRPKLVALRDTLLMFTPDTAEAPVTVHAVLELNGAPVGEFELAHPNALPASDHQGRHRIEYSTRAWSTRLPWDMVRNGLSITFVVDKGTDGERAGTLAAADLDIGEASQIVFQSIRLGMLADVGYSQGHFTLLDPVLAATDYFQTLPVSRMVMASYADMKLDRVIVENGKIYDEVSDTNGDVYSGDMRGAVAKSQVSVGINQANFGVSSSDMTQSYPHVFKQITNHHARGRYQNGVINHGLSGGNGIGTLVDSRGNEASHEWGHAYGLGHFPGANLTADGRWQRHHADSGWGFIAHRNRMRDNLSHNSWSAEEMSHGSHFMGRIPYRRDAMSGGSGGNQFSAYTHYTGFSARIIQNDLARFPIPDTAYPTGYKKWNTETGEYETWHFPGNTSVAVPAQVGVPVATLLGGYDPDGTNAVIYPVFHGNYGNVFELPAPATTGNACWLDVRNADGAQKQIAVAPYRHASRTINQFHVNLEADFRPTEASLHCRRNGTVEELARTGFDGQIPELPPVAIVGQEHGFKQLAEREAAELNRTLNGLSDQPFPVLDANSRILLASQDPEALRQRLDATAQTVLDTILERDHQLLVARALVNRLSQEKTPALEIRNELADLLMDSGILRDAGDIELSGTVLRVGALQVAYTPDGNHRLPLLNSAEEHPEAGRWIMSARGSLHPVQEPWQCLIPAFGGLSLTLCDPEQRNQEWMYTGAGALKNAVTGTCMDLNREAVTVNMYNCHGHYNQNWGKVPVTDSAVLATLTGELLKVLYQP